MTRPDFKLRCSTAFAVLAAFTATTALAQDIECESDADCDHGFVCETGSFVACPAIEPVCPPEEPCPLPDCEPQEYASCVLAPCEEDSDCPSGMTCESNTWQDCIWDDVACEEGQPCPEPEPRDCMDVTETYCAAPWELPCTQDSDCGEGFACVELESCSCPGSAGSAGGSDGGGSDSGEPPPDESGDEEPVIEPSGECSCEPSGEFWCEQQEIVCTADSDCPSDWKCDENPQRPVCSSASTPEGEPVPESDCGGDAPERTCQPPYYARGGGGFVTLEQAASSGLVDPKSDSAASNGLPADDSAAAGGESDTDGASNSSSAGGCAVSALAPGNASAWLLALGWLALRRRRR